MKTIVDKKWYRTDVFEQVTEVPDGYFVWAIGRGNFQYERCVPLAKDANNEEEWHCNIDVTSLKYIEVESEVLALRLLNEALRKGCDKSRFYEIVNDYSLKKNRSLSIMAKFNFSITAFVGDSMMVVYSRDFFCNTTEIAGCCPVFSMCMGLMGYRDWTFDDGEDVKGTNYCQYVSYDGDNHDDYLLAVWAKLDDN